MTSRIGGGRSSAPPPEVAGSRQTAPEVGDGLRPHPAQPQGQGAVPGRIGRSLRAGSLQAPPPPRRRSDPVGHAAPADPAVRHALPQPSGPQASRLWKARSPLQTAQGQVTVSSDHPFGTGSSVRAGTARLVTKAATKPPGSGGRTAPTEYFAKPPSGTHATSRTLLARHANVEFVGADPAQGVRPEPERRLHYALAEVSAGLAFQRFFGEDFTPKSRLIVTANEQVLVGMKLVPDIQTFEDIEHKLGTPPIAPWEPGWDPEDTSWHQPTVELRADGAACLPQGIGANAGKEVLDLGKFAAATWFLAERDTGSGNFGVVPTEDGEATRIVKLDHGFALWFEPDPGTTTRAWETLVTSPADLLTPRTLEKRLEDVGGSFPETSRPFAEYAQTIRQIAGISDAQLSEHIDAIVGTYSAQHEADGHRLESDLRARLGERVAFAREAVAAFDAAGTRRAPQPSD